MFVCRSRRDRIASFGYAAIASVARLQLRSFNAFVNDYAFTKLGRGASCCFDRRSSMMVHEGACLAVETCWTDLQRFITPANGLGVPVSGDEGDRVIPYGRIF